MECRQTCGACCIAPSINQPFYGMPRGKPAGVRCVHLDESMRCRLFGNFRRPALCDAFVAEPSICGEEREHALVILAELEVLSSPPSPHRETGS
jgi:Fe-S-cluster containining protein